MKHLISFSAKQARELANVPNTLKDIEKKIKEHAAQGEVGFDYPGRLVHEVRAALHKADYETTWKPECNTTWIWWG
jgi:hypothetical protein